MDRLQALRVFLAVADAQSFTAGAQVCGLSASSATRGINALEQQLGTRLFTRTTRQVRLTEAGATFAEDIREVLTQLETAQNAVTGAARKPTGRLRITCPQEFGRLHIAPLIAGFLEAYPDIRVEMLLVDRVVNLLEEGYDVALRIGELPSSGLSAIRVGAVRRVICGSPAYFRRFGRPESPADLSHHRIIEVDDSRRAWQFSTGRGKTVRLPHDLQVSSVAAAIEIARHDWGLCSVLSYQVVRELGSRELEEAPVPDATGEMPVHLVHAQGARPSARLRVFLDYAAEHLRRLPALRP